MTNTNYYNDNDQEYINSTIDLDMTPLADKFLNLVGDEGVLLDLGCGSGRDAVYFKSRGYDVYAMDGSEAMVKHAKEKLGDRVNWSTFEDYKTNVLFDGIWACASLLHVPRKEMNKILVKYRDLLKPDGVFFMSFKKGKVDYHQEGRSFTCYEKEDLKEIIEEIDGFLVIKIVITQSAKKDSKDEKWVSAFIRRT